MIYNISKKFADLKDCFWAGHLLRMNLLLLLLSLLLLLLLLLSSSSSSSLSSFKTVSFITIVADSLTSGCLLSLSHRPLSEFKTKKCFDTTNPTFFFSSNPLFSNFYCLNDSTFLKMLAAPCKRDSGKVPTLYDIPNFSK